MDRLELARRRAAIEPPWDEVREQRVLRRATQMRSARARQRRIASRVAVLAVAATLLALLLRLPVLRTDGSAMLLPRALPTSWELANQPSVVTLSEGSRITIPPSARVDVAIDRAETVSIVQTAGRARYEVSPRRERTFVVQVVGVTVSVVGTAFEVELEPGAPPTVAVRVERGIVRVDDGRREVELGAGEQLRLQVDVATSTALPAEPPRPTTPSSPPPSASAASAAQAGAIVTPEELLARADAARGTGQLADAALALEELLALHPNDPRAPTARFMLGKVERTRGDHPKAAGLFRASAAEGPLAEDALAEEAAAWAAAGRPADARAAAERYLTRFPSGPHAALMRRMLE
jgi:hypothetical protein